MRLYRFRTNNKNTLDELEKNYFYFALPNELNDPMEGFINLYWEGDRVLWKNFLKHYLYTLTNTIINIFIEPTAAKINLPIYFDESRFPSKEFKNIFEDIRNAFFSNKEVLDFIDYITKLKHRIYIKELKNYLGLLQLLTLSIILNKLKEHSILDWNMLPIKELNVFRKFKKIMPLIENEYSECINIIFDVVYKVKNEMNLSFKMNFKDIDQNEIKYFLINEFPNKYINQVRTLAFSTPCMVSFMEDYSSPAFWGYYGENHKGICLIFDNNEESDEICFDFKTTWGGIAGSTRTVKYKTEFENVNFFRMLGSLSLYAIDKFWLTDWDGNRTEYLKIGENYLTDEWRREYNKTLLNSFSVKLPDWKKEKEHRIVFPKEMVANDSVDSRKFPFDFNLLKGIIFGFRTDDEYKVQVINIIKGKCEALGRKDFHFYQAEYNEKTGLIQMGEIRI